MTYKVTAKLEPGLHIYAVAKPDENREGPIPTTFDFFDPAGLKIAGDWKPDHEPEARPEPAFNNQIIEFFENEVTWSITSDHPRRRHRRQADAPVPGGLPDLQRPLVLPAGTAGPCPRSR